MSGESGRHTRRFFLGATASAAALPPVALAARADHSERLWYRQPAARWEEALPLGNGRIGAMVFGRIAQERLQLNEDTLWSGAPYTPDNPDALEAIPRVRALIDAGEFARAAELASARVMAKPLQQMSYGTLGDLLIDFADASVPENYQRELELRNAVVRTEFTTGQGRFVREAWVSAPHQVLVLRLEGPRGKLSFDLRYRAPRKANYPRPDFTGAATVEVSPSRVDWLAKEQAGALPDGFTARADGAGSLLIVGRNEAHPPVAAGLSFAVRVQVLSDGELDVQDGGIRVRGARTATVLVCAATSFVNYRDVSGDPVAVVRAHGERAARAGYERLKLAHVVEYRGLYRTASLTLPAGPAADQPTDVRVANSGTADDPGLAALYFQFARYLLISSSRPGSQPANLQGVWNEGTNPPWGSKYTININTEMNYWPADAVGLGACVEPLLRLVEELAQTGAKTARTMYGARGWVAHHNTDLWRAAAPIDGPLWGLWPCGGAWLCNALWDHYDYTRDRAVLGRLYPLLFGASLYFVDTLVEDPKGRGLVTSPSLSPENVHPFGAALCAGPAMDRQILRDLFAQTLQGAALLGRDDAELADIRDRLRRLAPDRVGKQGQLQEWLEDWDGDAPEPHHRHVSHLYGVYPSQQINVRDTPELIEAAKVSLRQRGDLATGWGTAWRLCLWARMGDAEHAHSVLRMLLGPQRTYPNLFDAHPPFQIDGNFGGCAGIVEMLVQGWGGEIRLLPALPQAWPSGELRGIRVRGNIVVDLGWRAGRVAQLRLSGPPGAEVRVRSGGELRTVRLDGHGRYRQ